MLTSFFPFPIFVCVISMQQKSGQTSMSSKPCSALRRGGKGKVSQSVMQSPRKRRIAVSFHSNMAKILEENWTSAGSVVCSWVWGQRIWLHPKQMILLKKLLLPQAPGSSYINLRAEGSFRAHEHSFILHLCKEIWVSCSLTYSKLKILQYLMNVSLWK